jgi:hypothetical protein
MRIMMMRCRCTLVGIAAMACTPSSASEPAPVVVAAPNPTPKPAAPRCGDQVLLGSKVALAQSPRPDLDAERLALRTIGTLVAPDAAYARIGADLKAIRTFTQGKPGARRTWPSVSVQTVVLRIKPQAQKALLAGTYKGMDCLNAWYGGRFIPVVASADPVFVTFKGWFHGQRIAAAYRDHPDVLSSGPSTFGGAGDDITLCNPHLGGTHRYMFSHGSGDCLAGCIDWLHRGYEVTSAGAVVELKPRWKNTTMQPPTTPPVWTGAGCLRGFTKHALPKP